MTKSLKLILIIGILINSIQANATHANGATISLTPTSIKNQFRFILTLYRDCSGFDVPRDANIVFKNDCGFSQKTIRATNPVVSEVNILCDKLPADSTNCASPPGPYNNAEKVIFTGLVILQPCNSWHITYGLNARNPNDNIGRGLMWVETSINNSGTNSGNTTPHVYAEPIPRRCKNAPISYPLNIYEPDGDSLHFSFTTPLGRRGNPYTFNNPLSASKPMPIVVGTSFKIDASTGLLNFTPSTPGTYVLAILIREFNSFGILISSTIHDMQFVIEDCDAKPPIAPDKIRNFSNLGTGAQWDSINNVINLCDGDSFCFEVSFSDPDTTDTLTMTSDIHKVLPGATFTITGTNPIVGKVCWNYEKIYSGNTISFNVSDNLCPSPGRSTFIISIDIPLILTLSPDDSICGNQSVDIEARGEEPITWTLLNGDPLVFGPNGNFSCDNCPTPNAKPKITSTYVAHDGSICQFTDTITIKVAENYGGIYNEILTSDTSLCIYDNCFQINSVVQKDSIVVDLFPYAAKQDIIVSPGQTKISLLYIPGGVSMPIDTVVANSIKEICIDIKHDEIGELDIYVIAPDGSEFLLSSGNGAKSHNFISCFDNTAFQSVTEPNVSLNSGASYIPQAGTIDSAFVDSTLPDTVPTFGFWNLKVVNRSTRYARIDEWSITFCEDYAFKVSPDSIKWNNLNGMPPGPFSSKPTICPTQSGNYKLTVFNDDFCFVEDSLNVTILPMPNPGDDTKVEICINEGMINLFDYLGGEPDIGGIWQDTSGNVVNPNINSFNILDNQPYLYIANNKTTPNKDGCIDSSYLTIHTIIIDVKTEITQPSCYSFCDGEIVISGTNFQSFSLNGTPPVNQSKIFDLCQGTYDITVYSKTDGKQCSLVLSSINLIEPKELIITNHTGYKQFENNDTAICKGDSIPLFVSGQGGFNNPTYSWYYNNDFTKSIGNGSLLIAPIDSGLFTVIMREKSLDGKKNCPQAIESFRAYQPKPIFPKLSAGPIEGCVYEKGHKVTFDAIPSINSDLEFGFGGIIWGIENNPYIFNDHRRSWNYTFEDPGLYDIAISIKNEIGCTYDTIYKNHIQAFASPKLNFATNPQYGTVLLPTLKMVNLSSPEAIDFTWDFGSNSIPILSAEANPKVKFPKKVGKYNIHLTAYSPEEKGYCKAETNGLIQIVSEAIIYAPNIFTPDGNTRNDIWKVYIDGIDIYDFKLTIFNRYGEIIWMSYDPNFGWDGTHRNGSPVMNGTYPWIITTKDQFTDKKYEFKGTVNLIK